MKKGYRSRQPGSANPTLVKSRESRIAGMAFPRLVRSRPSIPLVAIATLALGIGGATAIFSVADAVILRPLPFADPGRIVLLWQKETTRNQPFVELSYPSFREWREQSRSFVEMAGMPSTNMGLLWKGNGEPQRLLGRWVTGHFFSVMGVAPMLGRTFSDDDDKAGAARVIVLSHALWREQFSADPAIVGRSLELDGKPYTVVGVMPPSFAYPAGATFWTPLVPPSVEGGFLEDAGVMWMSAIGRLRPDVSVAEATAEMSGIANRYGRERFKATGYAAVLTPLSDAVLGSSRAALWALLGAVGLVLLIACSNVAGLLLVDLIARSSELAVRQALGASLSVLGRSLFVESLTLAICGGVLGVAVAVVLVPVLIAFSPADVFRLADASVNPRALLFAVSAAVVTALLCSLAPLLLLRRLSLEAFLRAGARGVVAGRSRLRSFLVVSEVAIALVLLIGAGLLFRSFLSLRALPLGFEPAGLMSVSVGLPDEKPEVWRPFLTQVIERISGLPGVSSAASVTLRPLWGTVGMDWPFTVFGQTKEEAGRNPLTNLEAVSADYFRTMNIPLRRGRAFTSADSSGAPGVVVVSESMARRYWPAADPLGQRLKIPLPGTPYHDTWLTVVGVAADARYRELRNSRLDLYMSFLQADHKPHHVVVRFSGDASTLADAIRRVVRSLDADQPVEEVVLMSSVVTSALGGPRFAAQLFSAFAGIALLLCGLGLYGLLSFSVSRRTREIGVRVAVGATPASVRRLVLGQGLALAALGIALGLSGAAIGSRALSGLLFGVQPIDPTTFAVVPAVLLLVALLASALPAARAARVDPVVALRAD
jgi:putative ABC transport system permease protein